MIGGDLEYLMCSLPALNWQKRDEDHRGILALLSDYTAHLDQADNPVEMLHVEAQKFLSKKLYRQFVSIDWSTIHKEEYRQSGHAALGDFSIFVYRLKKELRAYRLARKEGSDKVNNDLSLLGQLSDNPLQAEMQLLKMQWDKLEELSIGHYADFTALVLYKLKLLLLKRWWSFDTEKGFDVFRHMINTE